MLPDDRPTDKAPVCPTCQGEIRFVRSMSMSRDITALLPFSNRFFFEIVEYHCEKDGAVYLTREGMRREEPPEAGGYAPGVREPLHPRPVINHSGIALSEPFAFELVEARSAGARRPGAGLLVAR